MDMKECTKCKKSFDAVYFKLSDKEYKRCYKCRIKMRDYRKKYQETNPEAYKKQKQAYYQKHKEVLNQKSKERQFKQKEYIKELEGLIKRVNRECILTPKPNKENSL